MSFLQHLDLAKDALGVSFQLKPEQTRALEALYEGKDAFAMLRTGFGKSLIFQLSPFLLGYKRVCDETITLIISPLNSIMEDQVRKLCLKGISCCYLDMKCASGESFKYKVAEKPSPEYCDTEEMSDGEEGVHGQIGEEDEASAEELLKVSVPMKDIRSGDFRLVYAHPEALLTSPQGRKLLRSEVYRNNVCCVAVDEAHMIYEWGEDFRTDFGRIQEVFSLYPTAPALVVTATASPIVREKIIQNLDLRKPVIITSHPDRDNIMYFKYQRKPSYEKQDDIDNILLDIAQGLQTQQQQYPITVLYADLEDICYIYRYLEEALQEKQFAGAPVPENRLFGMYHQAYSKRMKEHIVSELSTEQSKIRFVAATVALGMGLDAPAIRNIIHFKSPTSLERYLQETGRAGRDGKSAKAVLYFNNTDLRSNRPGQQPAIVSYCRSSEKCLRHILMQYLGFTAPENRTSCRCCQVCAQTCECQTCMAQLEASPANEK